MLEVLAFALLRGTVAVTAVWLLVKIFKGTRPSIQKHLWWAACLVFLLGLISYGGLRIPVQVPENLSGPLVAASKMASPTFEPQSSQGMVKSPVEVASLLLLGLWGLGVLVQIYRLGHETVRLRKLIRSGQPLQDADLAHHLRELSIDIGLSSPPKLVESDETGSPLVVGLVHPTIVVPAGFSKNFSIEEGRLTLAHELAHLKGNDVWLGLVPIAVRTLFWFFPPAHWASYAWETGRETAADAAALALIGSEPVAYKRLLLRIAVENHSGSTMQAIGATASFHTLKTRLAQLGRQDKALNAAWLAIPVLVLMPWQVVPVSSNSKSLLKNAGFESGTEQVNSWETGQRIHGVQYLWDRSTSHTGTSSLAMFKTIDKYFPIAEWTQTIAWDGKSRQIGVWAWVKTESAYKTVLDVQFFTPDGVQSHAWAAYIGAQEDGDPPITQGWKRVGSVIEIPEGTTAIAIAPQMYGPGKVWYDDIEARWMSDLK